MQFLVIGRDGDDEGALGRRLAAHEAHARLFREMCDQGVFLYGAAILNDDGQMIGSLIVCDFTSREEMEERWLKDEPYVIGDVWQEINVHRAHVPPRLLKP